MNNTAADSYRDALLRWIRYYGREREFKPVYVHFNLTAQEAKEIETQILTGKRDK